LAQSVDPFFLFVADNVSDGRSAVSIGTYASAGGCSEGGQREGELSARPRASKPHLGQTYIQTGTEVFLDASLGFVQPLGRVRAVPRPLHTAYSTQQSSPSRRWALCLAPTGYRHFHSYPATRRQADDLPLHPRHRNTLDACLSSPLLFWRLFRHA